MGLRAFGDERSPGCAGPSDHLLLGDSRLLLAVPLAVMQTHSIPVKQVQVVDSHLQGTRYGPRSRTAHTPRTPVFRPRSLQPGGILPWTHRNCSECPSQGTSCTLGAPLLPVLAPQRRSSNSTRKHLSANPWPAAPRTRAAASGPRSVQGCGRGLSGGDVIEASEAGPRAVGGRPPTVLRVGPAREGEGGLRRGGPVSCLGEGVKSLSLPWQAGGAEGWRCGRGVETGW